MTSHLARIAAGFAVGTLLALVPTAAFGDSTGSIDYVETADRDVQVLFSVTDLPVDVTPDPDTVTVTVNGDLVEADATIVAEDADALSRTAVLAIDVSKSMAGPRFAAAKQAALAYIDSAPDNVSVALVTFADDVKTVEPPTQDKNALVAAVNSLELTLDTRLYDGILQALDVAGTEGSRRILLLSDGKDTSTTSLDTVIAASTNAGIPIDVVALNQQITAASPLTQVADASDGTVTSISNLAELEALFTEEAIALAKQLAVSFLVPESLDVDEGTLAISVEAAGTSYRDEAYVSLASVTAGTVVDDPQYRSAQAPRFEISRPVLLVGIAMLFAGFGVFLAFGMTRMMPVAASPMQQQLALYTADGMRASQEQQRKDARSQLKGSAVKVAEGLVQKRDFEASLATKLDRAGLSLKAAEWLLLHAGIAVGAALAGLVLTGGSILLALVSFAAGATLPWFFLSFKASRRIKGFNAALAQTLQIVAGALQAGLSLPQAVDTVVQEGDEVVSEEFRRAIIEQRLGVEIEDALDSVADRMGSADFKWVVMAVRIQREVGGNLSELLLTVAGTLREREYLRRQVSVLSAEGRLSAWILGGMPPLFLGYLLLTKPEYVAPMFNTALGLLMLGTASVMMLVGSFWLKKTVKVEV
jgi:tight adherence protein B